jgi:hypothetical protein
LWNKLSQYKDSNLKFFSHLPQEINSLLECGGTTRPHDRYLRRHWEDIDGVSVIYLIRI